MERRSFFQSLFVLGATKAVKELPIVPQEMILRSPAYSPPVPSTPIPFSGYSFVVPSPYAYTRLRRM